MDACSFGLVWWASGALSHLGALVTTLSASAALSLPPSAVQAPGVDAGAGEARAACAERAPHSYRRRQRAARRRSRPRAQKNRNLDIPCLYSRRRGHAHEPAVDGEQALARFREAATAGQPLSLVEAHAPPPLQSKASLKAWWNTFSLAHSLKKDTVARAASAPRPRPCAPSPHSHRPAPPPPVPEEHPVFGKPLRDSHKYASVQISTANASGELYVWGYIAVVVAKWCVARARRACPCSRPPARSISRKTNPVR
jgi:hypothetical protein